MITFRNVQWPPTLPLDPAYCRWDVIAIAKIFHLKKTASPERLKTLAANDSLSLRSFTPGPGSPR